MLSGTVVERFKRIGWDVTEDGCWEWRGSRHVRGGYGQLAGPNSVPLKTHRVSYALHKGGIPEGLFVRHECDNPPCVNPTHLVVGTHQENMNDALGRGRSAHQVMTGEHCPASKLTWRDVEEIRSSSESGVALAKRFRVSKTSISKVRRYLTWKTPGNVETRSIKPPQP